MRQVATCRTFLYQFVWNFTHDTFGIQLTGGAASFRIPADSVKKFYAKRVTSQGMSATHMPICCAEIGRLTQSRPKSRRDGTWVTLQSVVPSGLGSGSIIL
ncbi:MAG: hypothetical protein RL329_2168 [Bacteroidota bacterium]